MPERLFPLLIAPEIWHTYLEMSTLKRIQRKVNMKPKAQYQDIHGTKPIAKRLENAPLNTIMVIGKIDLYIYNRIAKDVLIHKI